MKRGNIFLCRGGFGALARLTANHFQWFLLLRAVWIKGAAAGIEPGCPQGCRSLAR